MNSKNYSVQKFETDIFKQPVWKLLKLDQIEQTMAEARTQNVALVSFRTAENAEETKKKLSENGFYPIETLTKLSVNISDFLDNSDQPSTNIREATIDDIPAVMEIARDCFINDRYHEDPNIDNRYADEIKAQWMRNAIKERADKVFLFEKILHDHQTSICGFNACLLQNKKAIIDLIGVSKSYQGQGVGYHLIAEMARYYKDKADEIILGTQETNIQSQNFYQKLGFKYINEAITWHWTG